MKNKLTLTLLMTRVCTADNIDIATTADHGALWANLFD